MTVRTLLASATVALFAAPAFAGTGFTLETAAPVTDSRVVSENTVWACAGTVCRAELSRKAPTVRVCKELAKQVGEIKSLRSAKGELSAADLAKCNAAAVAKAASN